MKPGVQGRSPGPLSPHFSGEMGTPAGQAGPRGAAPRGFGKALTTQRVRSTVLPPADDPGWDRCKLAPAGWSLGYVGAYLRTLIWRLPFIKCFSSIFSFENASQIDLSIPEEIAPPTCQRNLPQNPASGNERL